MPHVGTEIPDDIKAKLNTTGTQLDDTDWHIQALYDSSVTQGASIIQPRYSRYVIDLNRPPDGGNLYPGQNTTSICPTTTFDGVPLYRTGMEPDDAEVSYRLLTYWTPYHVALQEELDRLKAQYGYALLWDAHSIRSVIPHLFEGELPIFNFGSANGASCEESVAEDLVLRAQKMAPTATAVLNGRFKGGYITRNYGVPANHVQAIQLELAQRSYMKEILPYSLDFELAAELRKVLASLIKTFISYRPR
jgi:N-formylglutamate deformylase